MSIFTEIMAAYWREIWRYHARGDAAPYLAIAVPKALLAEFRLGAAMHADSAIQLGVPESPYVFRVLGIPMRLIEDPMWRLEEVRL